MVGADAGEARRDEAQGGEEVKSKPRGAGVALTGAALPVSLDSESQKIFTLAIRGTSWQSHS